MKRILAIAGLWLASIIPSSAAVFILQAPVVQTGASPTVTTDGVPESYVGGGPAIVLENTLAIACSCSTLDSATVTISSGAFTGDVLEAPTQVGITAGFTSNTLTLTGTAAISTYLAVLQNVTYSSSNADPTNTGSNPTRTITWNAVNNGHGSNSPTTTVNVAAGDAVPVLTPSGSIATFTSSGSPVAIDGGVTLTCSCTNLTSAVIDIGTGFLGGDVLNAGTPGSLSQVYDSSGGTLTLTGTATVATYQTALRSIVYSSTLTDPTNSGANPTRALAWSAINNTAQGTMTSTVNVQNPSQPTINLGPNNAINFTAGGSPLVVNGGINTTCSCANYTSATLTLSTGFFTGDILAATTSLGITTVYNSSTGVMTFTGTTTVANYQTLLRTITYSSSSGDPSNGGLNQSRVATWVVFNGANASAPVTTAINVFIAGQPSWAMTGAAAAINPATSQSWVNGLGTGPIAAEITVTRSTTEACYGGVAPNYVTFAAPNIACTTPTGMAVWPSYTNYLTYSNDASNTSGWNPYCGASGNCPAGGSTVVVTGNSVLDPTGATSKAAKVAVTRTATGNYAAVINNATNAPAGLYSAGFWLQADTPGDVGKVIQFAFLSSAGFTVKNLTLPATWTWVQFFSLANITAGCNSATQSCQFQIGLTNQPGSGPTSSALAATFDVWGGELNGGGYAFPSVATTSTPITVQADNIAIQAGSALETALNGPASSVIMNSNLGSNNFANTLLDSNGTTWLGQTGTTNHLTTALSLSASTTNTANWFGPNIEGFSRNGSGRSMGLNGALLYKDIQSTVIGVPIYLGSTLGTQNFFGGYLGTLNAFNTRVNDSLLGQTGVGTDYYFAASGNDSNPCTIGAPCQSITKANAIPIVTNDTMNFNGGDTFVGCLTENGAVNWNATRVAPATIQSYGTGQATLTGNCTTGSAKIGIINLFSTDGVIINNLHLVGDTAGNANRGISVKNCDFNSAHGNITIQNNTMTGIHDGPASNHDFGAGFFQDGSCNNAAFPMDHISILNNTDAGASPSATDNAFVNGYGYKCSANYDVIQGNLVFNLGGDSLGFGPAEGTGMEINSCGIGSTGTGPNGLPGGIVQFNVVHDDAANNNTACGSSVALWVSAGDAIVFRMNEVYRNGIGTTGGCDKGAFDIDSGGGTFASNSLVERNYTHGNFGPMMLFFGGNNNTARWNIGDGDGVAFTFHGHEVEQVGSGQIFFYNNVAADSTFSNAVMSFTGCPAAGSLMANNIFVSRSSGGTQFFFNMGEGAGGTQVCSNPPPTGGLTFTHNDWWATGAGALRWWIDNQGSVGTITGTISGTTLTSTSATGTTKIGAMITGTGIPASTYITGCQNPLGTPITAGQCVNGAYAWTISKPATTGAQTNTTAASAATFANAELLLNESGGLNLDPLFVSPYAQTTCGNTTGGPQSGNCPSGMHLQGGSAMHAPAGAVLSSQPFNLPANNGGTAGAPTNGQGTKDYWGNALPCPTVGGFPIGAEC